MATRRMLPAIQQLIADPDLAEPLHDEILLWIQDHIQEAVARAAGAYADSYGWNEEAVAAQRQQTIEDVRCLHEQVQAELQQRTGGSALAAWGQSFANAELEAILTALDTWPGLGEPPDQLAHIQVRELTWQFPVRDSRGTIVGFADLKVECQFPMLMVLGVKNLAEAGADTLATLRATPQDALAQWHVWGGGNRTLYLDVRAEISSLGRLLREVRLLREHLHGDYTYVVVSPEDRFAPILREQGLGYVHYGDRPARKQATRKTVSKHK